MAKGANLTFISLIPESSDPLTMDDYRPIGLVGCQHKILAKVLAERLKVVMPTLISENQSAFVGGHQILDGVLIANEIINWATTAKKKLMLLKIDFAKAYDSVNWDFLYSIMEQMKFGLRCGYGSKGVYRRRAYRFLLTAAIHQSLRWSAAFDKATLFAPFYS